MLPIVDLESDESFPIGNPISAAELVLRPLLAVPVALLNICGNFALDKDDEDPSGGCMFWKDSNSDKSAFSVLRNSVALDEFRSITAGRDSPRRR